MTPLSSALSGARSHGWCDDGSLRYGFDGRTGHAGNGSHAITFNQHPDDLGSYKLRVEISLTYKAPFHIVSSHKSQFFKFLTIRSLLLAKILVIDDEQQLCDVLEEELQSMSHEVDSAYTLQEGLLKVSAKAYDIVFLDVRLPDGNGLDEINRIRGSRSKPEVIIMTGHGDPDGAELAIKNGAWDYIEKPCLLSNMILPMVRALQYRESVLLRKPAVAVKREGIVGNSPKMQVCFDQIAQAAGSDATVLIQGETGTGKELLAWAIHNNSARASQNFVVVDCASLPETLVESMLFGHTKGAYTGADSAHNGLILQADGGTLFLDEIGELPVLIQKSFLRVLQEHRFRPLGASQESGSDFRLVTATNRNLDKMVQAGQFRSDLLYRIRSFQIDIPPLRERLEDITELVFYHIMKICERYHVAIKGISPELLEMLQAYPWPGNVRELVNVLERVVVVARGESMLIPKHLPENVRIQVARAHLSKKPAQTTLPEWSGEQGKKCSKWDTFRKEAVATAEREYLLNLLPLCGNDVRAAMVLSGLSRSHLYAILKKNQLTFLS
jgi:two-component system, NtrC family, response regulator